MTNDFLITQYFTAVLLTFIILCVRLVIKEKYEKKNYLLSSCCLQPLCG